MVFERSEKIEGCDADGLGRCRPSALLEHLQRAATGAADAGGFGRNVTLSRYGAFWMLARTWVRLARPLLWGEELTVRTWHREDRGALMYRDYDLFVGGVPVGEAISAWVLTRLEDRRLLRLGTIAELAGTGGGSLCKTLTLNKLRLPEPMEEVERRPMRYSDADLNGHVNNARYADFACDVLEDDCLDGGRFLARMRIGYLGECRPGEILYLQRGSEEGEHFVRGADGAGNPRFEAALRFAPLPV